MYVLAYDLLGPKSMASVDVRPELAVNPAYVFCESHHIEDVVNEYEDCVAHHKRTDRRIAQHIPCPSIAEHGIFDGEFCWTKVTALYICN